MLVCSESVVVVSLVERGWDIFGVLMLLGRGGIFRGGLGTVLMIWAESYFWRRGGMSMSLSESSSQSVFLWIRDGSGLFIDELLFWIGLVGCSLGVGIDIGGILRSPHLSSYAVVLVHRLQYVAY